MKKLNTAEMLSSITLFGLGIFTLLRGVFWITRQNEVWKDSKFYLALHEFMPIWVWGLIVVISSAFLIFSSWFMPKNDKTYHILLLIGGATCSVMYLLMTSAALFNANSWLTPLQFATLSTICAVVAFIGGAELYAKR